MSDDKDTNCYSGNMQEVLEMLGLQSYIPAFEAQKISIEEVEIMTDEDFRKVGIDAIGLRLKIKQACRNFLKGNATNSPVVRQFLSLSSREPKKKSRKVQNERRNLVKNEKSTRRLKVGWKHLENNSYKLIPMSHGGGSHDIDVCKDTNYTDLVKVICSKFFPGDYNKIKNIKLSELTYYIGNFTGEPLPTMNGQFTAEKYIHEKGTNPVRVYLHTEYILPDTSPTRFGRRGQNPSLDDKESLIDIENLQTVNMAITDTSQTGQGLERQDEVINDTESLPDIENLQTVNTATQSALISPTTVSRTVSRNVPSPDPEVSFNPRALRLSLRQQAEDGITTRSTCGSHSTRTRVTEPVVVEILDSEDEELQKALLESLDPREHNEPCLVVSPEVDDSTKNLNGDDKHISGCADILRAFQQETVIEEQTTKILVMRSDILNTAFKSLKRKSVNLRGRLYVKFAGEIGEDAGGPRREFFRLVMKAMQQSSLFEGPECSRIFSHDITSLENGSYRLIGNLVALSLAQDGPGVHFLSPILFDIMTGKNIHLPEDGLPEEAMDIIKQLREAHEHSDIDLFLHNHGDKLLDIGISNAYVLVRKDKEKLIELLKKYYMSYRISGEISQFTRGMNEVNKAWDMITSHADVFKDVFCYKPNDIKNGEEFLKLCKVNYSEPGSNSRTMEDRSMYGFEAFLQSIEDGDVDITFSDLLVFITGASHVPPCGFDSLIDIEFYTDKGRLPSASTCALRFWMPRVGEADEISTIMVRALKESYGFMKV